MSKIPIEILNYSIDFNKQIAESVLISNKLQDSIQFEVLDDIDQSLFESLQEEDVYASELFDEMEECRIRIGGHHPYILLMTDKPVYDEYINLFGASREESGVGVVTTNSVADIIVPEDKMIAYIIYYFTRYTLNYLNPKHPNHKETRGCLYDSKISKLDILKSMKSDAFCKECQARLLTSDSKITIKILTDVNTLLGKTGEILNDVNVPETNKDRTKIFICYSHRDVQWKERLLVHLKPLKQLCDIDIWSDDQIRPGDEWFIEIRNAMIKSRIGILMISPDFLASDFIDHVEVPQLLKNVEEEGGKVIPIIIRHSLFSRIEKLSRFQATNSPMKPIAGLNESEQDAVFVRIAEIIWDLMEN